MTDDEADASARDYYDRLVDESALRQYLTRHLGPAEAVSFEHHREGHSNETLFVDWDEDGYVVRRPPPGETADSAHDVLREYHVVDALQGTDIPLPRTVAACDNPDVIGSDFYVVERLDGDVLRDDEPARFATPTARYSLGTELVDTLAAIHRVDYETVGLAEFGRPHGFTERQVDRWRGQHEWAFEVTAAEREIPSLERVGNWLEDNVPVSYEHSIVHGDYKLDNVLYGPGKDPEMVGVFDWELSTLGDPLTDLGWLLLFWYDEPVEPLVPELQSTFMAREGYPSRRELVERYEQRTGIEFRNNRFYRALAAYKLAALGEMFFRRYLEGNSDDPLYPLMRERVPALAEAAVDIIDGDRVV